ncbi:hypothetical protein F5B22DRAFT_642801 [Xylaria bambusicola]|uniref:uncharacterized protein n=1 Tax=Xylaria bambusicola TaxID=326684 RepID=UPI0020086D12|nr:uncharacterized protein F5B22DRAFT_642801 [Xylaria bambusicola]KAI0523699.1 hypothetical protein F5B22DRAFT_642801 [Xylaria bambusicola]
MPSSQQADTERPRKVAMLAELIQEPRNEKRIGPLVTMLLARNVDTHSKELIGLGDELKKTRDNELQHHERIAERILGIEHDAASLRQLVEAKNLEPSDTKAILQQLSSLLTETIKENRQNDEIYQIVRELVTGQQQTTSEIREALKKQEQLLGNLSYNIAELKGGLEGVSFDTERIRGSIVKLEETIQKRSKIVNLSLAATANQLDTTEQLDILEEIVGESLTGRNMKQSAISKDCAPGPFLIGTSDSSDQLERQPISLKDWPATTEFLAIYEEKIASYKSKQPDNETEFIKDFLSAINVHASCLLQRHFLKKRPEQVKLSALGAADQRSPAIFIELSGVAWKDIRRMIGSLNLKLVQTAVDKKISGSQSRHRGSLVPPR